MATERNKGGRPTECDEATMSIMESCVRRGLTLPMAASKAGISQSALDKWKARARDGDEPFCEFVQRMEAAEAEHAESLISVLEGTEEAPMTRDDAKFLLTHRHRNHFSPKTTAAVELSGTLEVTTVDVTGMNAELLAALRAKANGG